MPPVKKKKRRTTKKQKNTPIILITVLLTIIIVWLASNIMSHLRDGQYSSNNDSSNSEASATPVSPVDITNTSQVIEPITDDTTKQVSAAQQIDTTTQNTLTPTSKDLSLPKDTQTDNTMNISVYFIKISEQGKIIPVQYTRTIKKTAALLTETLQALLKGPTKAERDDGVKSYIPVNSKLLAVRVQNNTAFINFNEAFQFNESGYPGILAQLYQVVYTTTEISSIKDVQFLINGVVRQFSSSEGRIETASPITKVYLQSHNFQ